ncbi:DUF4402 domain-containing protein [Massilia niabensis]|uniref:DUF4402 domain-containing protein n=1 Tax=Massilia niabensis TaxID=544910 RepID=A0ABW0L7F1_9BURK
MIRFARIASCAALALLALPMADAFAQQVVTLSNARGLDFGRFVAGSGGTVVLSATGVRSRTGGVVLLNSPNAGQAVFNVGKSVNGSNNRAVIVTLPANGTIRLTSGANSMAVGSFVRSPTTATITIPNGGTTLSLGATLTVAPNQAPGTYSGSFPLTVNYQ